MSQIIGTSTAETLSGTGQGDSIYGGDGNDRLIGRGGNDWLFGDGGKDKLYGGGGDDRLYGGDNNDRLAGGKGDDILEGGAGKDVLIGGAGNDSLDGGEGIDKAKFFGSLSNFSVLVDVGTGVSTITDNVGNLGSDTFTNIEFFRFSDQTVSLAELLADATFLTLGTASDDVLVGGSFNNNNLVGFGGNDTLTGGYGDDFLEGGEGMDRMIAGGGSDQLDGGADEDTAVFAGNWSDYTIVDLADGGFELTYTGSNSLLAGTSTVTNTEVFEFLDITLETETLVNGPQIPSNFNPIDGTENLDYLFGTADADLITALGGNDAIFARGGDDQILGGSGSDQIDGGAGIDTVLLSGTLAEYDFYIPQSSAPTLDTDIRLTSTGADGVTEVDTISAVEVFQFADVSLTWLELLNSFGIGTDNDDQVAGSSGADFLRGYLGNDEINGGDGADVIFAGDGDDVLIGGAGSDVLYGGADADTFVFSQGDFEVGSIVTDFISDFAISDDKINLVGLAFDDLSITQSDQNTLIEFAYTDDIFGGVQLTGIDAGLISEDLFVFG